MYLAGNCSSLYVLTKHNQQRFEFIFTALTEGSPSLPAAVQALVAAYEASRPYRELRLRGGYEIGSVLAITCLNLSESTYAIQRWHI